MFWGVTLESGKRYSQNVSESYHLSMACLEPTRSDTMPANKEVCVMLEHGQSEYCLCVLEYGRVMQVNLDMIFDCGELVTYFLTGEGVVHLTGYALPEKEEEEEEETYDKPNNDVPTALNLVDVLDMDEDEEEDDEDWTPGKDQNSGGSGSDGESEESDNESGSEPDLVPSKVNDIDQNQLSETNEDEEADGAARGKRKMIELKGNKAKKRKVSSSSVENGDVGVKSKKQQKAMINHVDPEDGEDKMSAEGASEEDGSDDDASEDDSSVEYSSEEDKDLSSSIGRTPMPKKKISATTSLGESPELPHGQKKSEQKHKKKKLKKEDGTPANKESILTKSKNVKKLAGNLQVEDLRIGNGPPAKNGKFVFIHYEGKLTNDDVFESCQSPKKPFSFRMGRGEVIKGLDMGVEGMKVGGKRRITVPHSLGYGSQKLEVIPPNSTLIFTVELVLVR